MFCFNSGVCVCTFRFLVSMTSVGETPQYSEFTTWYHRMQGTTVAGFICQTNSACLIFSVWHQPYWWHIYRKMEESKISISSLSEEVLSRLAKMLDNVTCGWRQLATAVSDHPQLHYRWGSKGSSFQRYMLKLEHLTLGSMLKIFLSFEHSFPAVKLSWPAAHSRCCLPQEVLGAHYWHGWQNALAALTSCCSALTD